MKYCTDKDRTYIIGGYSLAGLFALWAAYQTDVFCAVAAASSNQRLGKKLSACHLQVPRMLPGIWKNYAQPGGKWESIIWLDWQIAQNQEIKFV